MPLAPSPVECHCRQLRPNAGLTSAAFVVRLSGLVECPGMPVGLCMIKAEGARLDVRSIHVPQWPPLGCSVPSQHRDEPGTSEGELPPPGFQVPGRSDRRVGSGLLLGRSRSQGPWTCEPQLEDSLAQPATKRLVDGRANMEETPRTKSDRGW